MPALAVTCVLSLSLFFFYVRVLLIDFHYLFLSSCRALSLHIISLSLSFFFLLSTTPLILSLCITLTVLLLRDCCYQSPIHSFLHTCLVLIVFFVFIILFNTFVGLIHPPFIILSFHHSPPYCGTWDSI